MVRCTSPLFPRLAAAVAALVVVGSLQAQAPRKKVRAPQPAVHQMEILNGASRTVRLFGNGISPGEAASLSDLERLENESSFAQDVLALKHQYVISERLLETHRRVVQQELYGRATTRTNYDTLAYAGNYGSGYYGSEAYRAGGYGFYRPASYATTILGDRTTETRNLADGVGDEGALKATLAAVIAKQAVPSYAASVAQDYLHASTVAAASPRLRAALSLPTLDDIRKENNAISAASFESPLSNRVTLTLANGKKVVGTDVEEGKEWITLKRLDGGTSRYRLSQVTQIDLPNNSKIKPAVDE